jgi:serine/threonine-protein kinase HipA
MALKLNGKDDRLRRADFKAFASTAGLKSAESDAAIDEIVTALSGAVERLELPVPLSDSSQGAEMAERMREIVRERINGFAG